MEQLGPGGSQQTFFDDEDYRVFYFENGFGVSNGQLSFFDKDYNHLSNIMDEVEVEVVDEIEDKIDEQAMKFLVKEEQMISVLDYSGKNPLEVAKDIFVKSNIKGITINEYTSLAIVLYKYNLIDSEQLQLFYSRASDGMLRISLEYLSRMLLKDEIDKTEVDSVNAVSDVISSEINNREN